MLLLSLHKHSGWLGIYCFFLLLLLLLLLVLAVDWCRCFPIFTFFVPVAQSLILVLLLFFLCAKPNMQSTRCARQCVYLHLNGYQLIIKYSIGYRCRTTAVKAAATHPALTTLSPSAQLTTKKTHTEIGRSIINKYLIKKMYI